MAAEPLWRHHRQHVQGRARAPKSGPNKGDFTEAAKDYAFRLAFERISGQLMDEGFTTWQMDRGHELEHGRGRLTRLRPAAWLSRSAL